MTSAFSVDWVTSFSTVNGGRPCVGSTKSASSLKTNRAVSALAAAVEGWEGTGRDPTGDRSWRRFANCAGVDPDVFYPERGASVRNAVALCADCVCIRECLAAGLLGNEPGIWGGTTGRARRDIWALARRQAREHPENTVVVDFVEDYKRVSPRGGVRHGAV